MSGATKRYLVVGGLAAVVAAVASESTAQGATPCPPGTAAPTISAQDFEAGAGGTLTATHTINLDAEFSDGLTRDSLQYSAPAGVTVRAGGGNTARLVSDAPGAVPVTVTWTEFQSDGTECTGTASTTLQLQAATPLSMSKLPRGLRPKFAKFSGGWSWATPIGRYTDRRPIEIRLRGVARARLPSPKAPFKVVTVALRAGDPGFDKQRFLRSPKWMVTSRFDSRQPQTFFLEARVKSGSVHDKPLGYELEALQAGRLLVRVRAAGKCNFAGCRFRTVRVQRGS